MPHRMSLGLIKYSVSLETEFLQLEMNRVWLWLHAASLDEAVPELCRAFNLKEVEAHEEEDRQQPAGT